MKKIIAPVDFSSCSWRAALYAAQLAQATGSSLILYHVHDQGSTLPDAGLAYIVDKEALAKDFEKLSLWADRLKARMGPDLRVYYYGTEGTPSQEVTEAVHNIKADLVVMGACSSSSFKQKVFGSTTLNVMRYTDRPLLVIPENASFSTPHKIAFASDYQGINHQQDLELLGELVRLFNAKLSILHIREPEMAGAETNISAEADHIITLMEEEKVEPELEFIDPVLIPAGINNYVKKTEADWLVMTPHWHGFFTGLFHNSSTEEIIHNTNIPILTFPLS